MHNYYIKDGSAWDTIPTQASLVMQRIFKAKKQFIEAAIILADIQGMDNYSIRDMYKKLRGTFPKVPWRRLVCNNYAEGKLIFIMRAAIHGKLYTKDWLNKWGVAVNPICCMCNEQDETHEHLLFACPFSAVLWRRMICWKGIERTVGNWHNEISWM